MESSPRAAPSRTVPPVRTAAHRASASKDRCAQLVWRKLMILVISGTSVGRGVVLKTHTCVLTPASAYSLALEILTVEWARAAAITSAFKTLSASRDRRQQETIATVITSASTATAIGIAVTSSDKKTLKTIKTGWSISWQWSSLSLLGCFVTITSRTKYNKKNSLMIPQAQIL